MDEAARQLHDLHPKYVRVEKRKTTKAWPGFDSKIRTDVTILWKKAYADGVSKKERGRKLIFLKR